MQADGTSNRGAKNYFEGRLYADPIRDVQMYTKMQLDSKSDDLFRFAESHLSFKKGDDRRGGEVLLFENEERLRFQDPLLEITQSRGTKSGFEDMRGIRANLWRWRGFANLVQGKIRSNGKADAGNDVYALRVGRNFFAKNRLTIAGTANGKVWSTGKNEVAGMDVTFRFGDAELTAAGATSHTTAVSKGDNTTFAADLRNLRVSSRRLGSLQLTTQFRNWGENYENFLGKNDLGGGPTNEAEKGVYAEVVYEVPFKALRLTAKTDIKEELRRNIIVRPLRRDKYWYGELFLQFQRGYKGKMFYEVHRDIWNTDLDQPNWGFQLESFSKFNTLKAQIKLKDYNNRYQKTIFGVENNHQLVAEKLFFLVRVLHAFEEEGDLTRTSAFTQILYKVRANGEVLFEFGNGDHGNDDLANDGSFADSSTTNTDRILKLFMKMWW